MLENRLIVIPAGVVAYDGTAEGVPSVTQASHRTAPPKRDACLQSKHRSQMERAKFYADLVQVKMLQIRELLHTYVHKTGRQVPAFNLLRFTMVRGGQAS